MSSLQDKCSSLEYSMKMEELQKYIPFLEVMIVKLTSSKDETRKLQIAKLKSLYSILRTKKKKLKGDCLKKIEIILKRLYSKFEKGEKVDNKNRQVALYDKEGNRVIDNTEDSFDIHILRTNVLDTTVDSNAITDDTACEEINPRSDTVKVVNKEDRSYEIEKQDAEYLRNKIATTVNNEQKSLIPTNNCSPNKFSDLQTSNGYLARIETKKNTGHVRTEKLNFNTVKNYLCYKPDSFEKSSPIALDDKYKLCRNNDMQPAFSKRNVSSSVDLKHSVKNQEHKKKDCFDTKDLLKVSSMKNSGSSDVSQVGRYKHLSNLGMIDNNINPVTQHHLPLSYKPLMNLSTEELKHLISANLEILPSPSAEIMLKILDVFPHFNPDQIKKILSENLKTLPSPTAEIVLKILETITESNGARILHEPSLSSSNYNQSSSSSFTTDLPSPKVPTVLSSTSFSKNTTHLPSLMTDTTQNYYSTMSFMYSGSTDQSCRQQRPAYIGINNSSTIGSVSGTDSYYQQQIHQSVYIPSPIPTYPPSAIDYEQYQMHCSWPVEPSCNPRTNFSVLSTLKHQDSVTVSDTIPIPLRKNISERDPRRRKCSKAIVDTESVGLRSIENLTGGKELNSCNKDMGRPYSDEGTIMLKGSSKEENKFSEVNNTESDYQQRISGNSSGLNTKSIEGYVAECEKRNDSRQSVRSNFQSWNEEQDKVQDKSTELRNFNCFRLPRNELGIEKMNEKSWSNRNTKYFDKPPSRNYSCAAISDRSKLSYNSEKNPAEKPKFSYSYKSSVDQSNFCNFSERLSLDRVKSYESRKLPDHAERTNSLDRSKSCEPKRPVYDKRSFSYDRVKSYDLNRPSYHSETLSCSSDGSLGNGKNVIRYSEAPKLDNNKYSYGRSLPIRSKSCEQDRLLLHKEKPSFSSGGNSLNRDKLSVNFDRPLYNRDTYRQEDKSNCNGNEFSDKRSSFKRDKFSNWPAVDRNKFSDGSRKLPGERNKVFHGSSRPPQRRDRLQDSVTPLIESDQYSCGDKSRNSCRTSVNKTIESKSQERSMFEKSISRVSDNSKASDVKNIGLKEQESEAIRINTDHQVAESNTQDLNGENKAGNRSNKSKNSNIDQSKMVVRDDSSQNNIINKGNRINNKTKFEALPNEPKSNEIDCESKNYVSCSRKLEFDNSIDEDKNEIENSALTNKKPTNDQQSEGKVLESTTVDMKKIGKVKQIAEDQSNAIQAASAANEVQIYGENFCDKFTSKLIETYLQKSLTSVLCKKFFKKLGSAPLNDDKLKKIEKIIASSSSCSSSSSTSSAEEEEEIVKLKTSTKHKSSKLNKTKRKTKTQSKDTKQPCGGMAEIYVGPQNSETEKEKELQLLKPQERKLNTKKSKVPLSITKISHSSEANSMKRSNINNIDCDDQGVTDSSHKPKRKKNELERLFEDTKDMFNFVENSVNVNTGIRSCRLKSDVSFQENTNKKIVCSNSKVASTSKFRKIARKKGKKKKSLVRAHEGNNGIGTASVKELCNTSVKGCNKLLSKSDISSKEVLETSTKTKCKETLKQQNKEIDYFDCNYSPTPSITENCESISIETLTEKQTEKNFTSKGNRHDESASRITNFRKAQEINTSDFSLDNDLEKVNQIKRAKHSETRSILSHDSLKSKDIEQTKKCKIIINKLAGTIVEKSTATNKFNNKTPILEDNDFVSETKYPDYTEQSVCETQNQFSESMETGIIKNKRKENDTSTCIPSKKIKLVENCMETMISTSNDGIVDDRSNRASSVEKIVCIDTNEENNLRTTLNCIDEENKETGTTFIYQKEQEDGTLSTSLLGGIKNIRQETDNVIEDVAEEDSAQVYLFDKGKAEDDESKCLAVDFRQEVKSSAVNNSFTSEEYYQAISNRKNVLKCKLCNISGKSAFLVKHYVTEHPNDEVSISRFSSSAAKDAKEQSLKYNNYENFINNNKSTFNCRMCSRVCKNIFSFYDHVTSHTGEYRHRCLCCSATASNKDSIKSHCQKKHPIMSSGKPDYNKFCSADVLSSHIKNEVLGYLCTECNFVQIKYENIKKHIKNNHAANDRDSLVIKINFSSESNVNLINEDDNSLSEMSRPVDNVYTNSIDRNKYINAFVSSENFEQKSETVEDQLGIMQDLANKLKLKEINSRAMLKNDTLEKLSSKLLACSDTSSEVSNLLDSSNIIPRKMYKPKTQDVVGKSCRKIQVRKEDDLSILNSEGSKVSKPEINKTSNLRATSSTGLKPWDETSLLNSTCLLAENVKSNKEFLKEHSVDNKEVCSNSSTVPVLDDAVLIMDNVLEQITLNESIASKGSASDLCKYILTSETAINVNNGSSIATENSVVGNYSQNFNENSTKKSKVRSKQVPSECTWISKTSEINTKTNQKPTVKYEFSDKNLTSIKVGCVSAVVHNGVLFFSCSAGQCGFQRTVNADLFLQHFEKHEILDEFQVTCSACLKKCDKSNENKLVASFLHLLNNHLVRCENGAKDCPVPRKSYDSGATNYVPSCTIKENELPVSPQPFIRVKRLMGDKLSTVPASEGGLCRRPARPSILNMFCCPEDGHKTCDSFESVKIANVVSLDQNMFSSSGQSSSSSTETASSQEEGLKCMQSPNKRPRFHSPLSDYSTGSNIRISNNQLISSINPISGNMSTQKQQLYQRCNPEVFKAVKTLNLYHRSGPEVVKAVKTLETYNIMLTPKKLQHLFKCMDRTCSFTCKSAKKFETHCLGHKANMLAKKNMENTVFDWRTCVYCTEVFNEPHDLCQHVIQEHSNCLLQCAFCFYRALSASNVIIHQNMSHIVQKINIIECSPYKPEESFFINLNLKPEVIPDRSAVVPPYKCAIPNCTFSAYTLVPFEKHLKDHYNLVKPAHHICPYCLIKVSRLENVLKHYKTHSLNLYQCCYCIHGTDNEGDMKKHLCIQHSNYIPKALMRVYENLSQKGVGETEENRRILDLKDLKECDFDFVEKAYEYEYMHMNDGHESKIEKNLMMSSADVRIGDCGINQILKPDSCYSGPSCSSISGNTNKFVHVRYQKQVPFNNALSVNRGISTDIADGKLSKTYTGSQYNIPGTSGYSFGTFKSSDPKESVPSYPSHYSDKPYKCVICGEHYEQVSNLLEHLYSHSHPKRPLPS